MPRPIWTKTDLEKTAPPPESGASPAPGAFPGSFRGRRIRPLTVTAFGGQHYPQGRPYRGILKPKPITQEIKGSVGLHACGKPGKIPRIPEPPETVTRVVRESSVTMTDCVGSGPADSLAVTGKIALRLCQTETEHAIPGIPLRRKTILDPRLRFGIAFIFEQRRQNELTFPAGKCFPDKGTVQPFSKMGVFPDRSIVEAAGMIPVFLTWLEKN